MAVVAQLVERRVVVLDVAGSSPVDRPFLFKSKVGELHRSPHFNLPSQNPTLQKNPFNPTQQKNFFVENFQNKCK